MIFVYNNPILWKSKHLRLLLEGNSHKLFVPSQQLKDVGSPVQLYYLLVDLQSLSVTVCHKSLSRILNKLFPPKLSTLLECSCCLSPVEQFRGLFYFYQSFLSFTYKFKYPLIPMQCSSPSLRYGVVSTFFRLN